MKHNYFKLLLKFVPIFLFLLIYFLVTPENLSQNGWRAFIIFLITIYFWATGTINISITALLVILLLMITNTVTPAEALSGFSSSALFLIIIGFLLGLGLVASGLDNRIVNYFLKICKRENTILAGIMGITAFLSMIMSNTTTTLLMLPIIVRIARKTKINGVALFLATAFSANIGGVGFLIGTPPNILVAEVLNLNFNEWFFYGFPFVIIMLILLYLSFYIMFKPTSKMIKFRVENLGRFTLKEKKAASIILLALILWFTSPFHNISTVTVGLLAGLLFLLTTYSWNFFQKHTDWGIVFLLGGAISMSNALQTTGAAHWMANSFLNATCLENPLFISYSFVLFSLVITQFIQNTATAAIMAPVLVSIANTLNINPIALVLPMGISVSMAFLLPSATAPNAIMFNKSKIKIKDMAKYGALPTFFALMALFVFCYILIY